MDNEKLVSEYKRVFDNVHASAELVERIKSRKPSKKSVARPYIAMISTVAAAVMVFAAVQGYNFDSDTDGVISQTTVSTETPGKTEELPIAGLPTKEEETNEEKKLQTEEKANINVPQTSARPSGESKPRSNTPEKATESVVKASQMPSDTANDENDVQAQNDVTAAEDNGVAVAMAINEAEDTPSVARFGGVSAFDEEKRTEEWEINRYYKYIGQDIGAKLGGAKYIGSTLTFLVDSDGNPTDDTAVLSYAYPTGGSVNVTVSKNPFFKPEKNGTTTAVDGGVYVYKISNGVYYCVYAEGIEQGGVTAIADAL